MADIYINLKDAKDQLIYPLVGYLDSCGVKEFEKRLENIPAADVRPVVQGKWSNDDRFYIKCSHCGGCVRAFTGNALLDYTQKWNFCPNCGADMRRNNDES